MDKNILTFDEAVELTGFTPSYLYKLTATRKVPHYKPTGRKLFFNRPELETWLLSNPIKTMDQIESDAATYITTHPRL